MEDVGGRPMDVVPYTGRQWLGDSEVPPTHYHKPVRIRGDIWIGPLGDLRTDIARAIDSPGENYKVPRPPTMRFAFYRRRAPETAQNARVWDADRALAVCIQLSRLIRSSVGRTAPS